MLNVLVIVAHPNFAQSQINKTLLSVVASGDNVTVHDLYASYPDGVIDVEADKIIVVQML